MYLTFLLIILALVNITNWLHFFGALPLLLVAIGGISIGLYALINLLKALIWIPLSRLGSLLFSFSLYMTLSAGWLGVMSLWYFYSLKTHEPPSILGFEWGYWLTCGGLISGALLEFAEAVYQRRPP